MPPMPAGRLPGPAGQHRKERDMKRFSPPPPLTRSLSAALAATLAAAPVWAAQNTSGEARVWLEYKGPQVLDACDPGMPSTHSAVNVEAFGGFFEPGIDSGQKHARIAFSPHDVLEYSTEPNVWDDLAILPNGQLRRNIGKGDNIIRFRQKASSYAPMPTSERRVIRVSLLTSCSDCRGAPGGTAISSQRTVFKVPPREASSSGSVTCNEKGCCVNGFDSLEGSDIGTAKSLGLTASDLTEKFSHTDIGQCRVRVQAPGAETYTWENCSTTVAGSGDNKYCYTVPNRRSDPVCEGKPVYLCQWDIRDRHSGDSENNTAHYRVVNNPRAIFEVQYNGYGCD